MVCRMDKTHGHAKAPQGHTGVFYPAHQGDRALKLYLTLTALSPILTSPITTTWMTVVEKAAVNMQIKTLSLIHSPPSDNGVNDDEARYL